MRYDTLLKIWTLDARHLSFDAVDERWIQHVVEDDCSFTLLSFFWFRFLELLYNMVRRTTVVLAKLEDTVQSQIPSKMIVIWKRCNELDQVEVWLVLGVLNQMPKLFRVWHILGQLSGRKRESR